MKKILTIKLFFCIVFAINMIWLYTIKSFAVNEPPSKIDNETCLEQINSEEKYLLNNENEDKHSVFILIDFAFWRIFEESIKNLVNDFFKHIKELLKKLLAKTKIKHNIKTKKRKQKNKKKKR